MYGLRDSDVAEILSVLRQFPEVESAVLFGSRAKGNYRNGSDVDLALKGDRITFSTILAIAGILNEDTLMPYRFDVLDYNQIANPDLVAHIERVGKLLYHKAPLTTQVNEPPEEYGKP